MISKRGIKINEMKATKKQKDAIYNQLSRG